MTDIQAQAQGATNALLDNVKERDGKCTSQFLETLPEDIKNVIFCGGTQGSPYNAPDGVNELLPLVCEKGDVALLDLLLEAGADPKLRGEMGSPIEIATFHNHKDLVVKLISSNKDLIKDPNEVKSCLAKACETKNPDMVEYWLGNMNRLYSEKSAYGNGTPSDINVDPPSSPGHNDLAGHVLQGDSFYITKDTVKYAGDVLTNVLEVWIEDLKMETGPTKLVAKWDDKHLYTFEQHWLEIPRYTDALVNIDLSNNSLGTIPRILLWGLPWLQTLSLAKNKINKLPAPASLDQAKKSSLQSLSISHNRLKDVPSELFLMSNLQELRLDHNQINTIKPAHIEWKVGKQDVSQSTWNCANLRELDLSNNHLIKIPSDIRGASKVTRLNLSHNKLMEMPSPWHCPLEQLFLSDNQLDNMPDMSPFWHQTLITLHIAQNKFTKIPLSVCYLTALESLDISGNAIKQLPAVMEWQAANLTRLDLSHNDLLHYDPEKRKQETKSPTKKLLKKFSSIERREPPSLDIRASRQSNFFADIDDVHGTLLFPKSFRSSLNVLDLSYNQLEAVPQSVCDMKALQALDVRGNCNVTSLPSALCLLTDLYSLKIDPGQIKHPAEVDNIVSNMKLPTRKIQKVLRDKMFNCQPYRGVKLMLVGPEKTGKTTLVSCLTGTDWPQDNKGVNVVQWNLPKPSPEDRKRSRSSVGSTSSSTSFISPSTRFKRLGRSQSQPEEDISLTVWDLKGGDNYAVVHQTLFTPHALYILVWDIGDREAGIEKLRPWLLNIQSRAPQSLIITVGTHLDQLSPKAGFREQTVDTLHELIEEKFPDLHDNFVEVEALNPNSLGVQDLKQLIYERALEMKFRQEHGPIKGTEPLVGRMVPEVFHVLKDRLSKELTLRHTSTPPIPPLMTEAELGNIIREAPTKQIQSAEQLEEVVAFLQDSGSLIHVSDHTYRLTNVYFLDPAWLCSVLFAVVQLHDDYYLENGIVPKTRLEELCQKSGFGRNRLEEYLQLLMRFEIALSIGHNRYLVPSLLPKGRPVFDRTAKSVFKHTLMRWYRMAYIPPGFWSRLVARLMVNVKNMDAKKTIKRRSSSIRRFSEDSVHLRQAHSAVWQEGMHVYHDGGQIQIEPMRFPDRRPGIRITIRDKRGVFQPMGFVVDHVETLLSEWYPGLEESRFDGTTHVQRLIPCPICLETLRNETGSDDRVNEFGSIKVFPLEDLAIAAALNNRNEIECEMHKDQLVPLRSLVPDLFLVDLGINVLEPDKLTIGRKLGSGGFGEVFKAEYKGKDVAVKRLMKEIKPKKSKDSTDMSSSGNQDDDSCSDEEVVLSVINTFPKLRGEVAVMSRLKHPCILELIGASVHKLLFAMEFAPMGDLASELQLQYVCSRPAFVCDGVVKGTILPHLITYKMALQVMSAITYLHNSRIIHTDLKTDNILLFSVDPEESINVKLADYGISHNLDAGGVRGEAGFHAFSAPEILKGKAFDEKVDIFSFGMLLYHIMSGVLPFIDMQNSVETKAAVTSGVRPSLQFKEYSMLPRFFHLENLMESCWQDSPDNRPQAKEIMRSMRNASFLCLRNVLRLESDSDVCLYGSAASAPDSSSQSTPISQYRMWLWRGHNERRSFIEFNIEHSSDADVVSNEWHGPKVTCAVQVNELHIHGTGTAKEDNAVNVFTRTCSGGNSDFAHQAELVVPSEVVSMCYIPHNQEKSTDEPFGYLFAGLKDGTVIIFVHQSSADDPTSDWNQFEIMKLGNNKPCTCMQIVPAKNELWVGCGNTIRIISVTDMNLDPHVIKAEQESDVQSFAHQDDHIWCFVQGSPVVMQYSVSSRKRIDTVDCGNVVMAKGEVLSTMDAAWIDSLSSNKLNAVEEDEDEEEKEVVADAIEETRSNDAESTADTAARPSNQSGTLPAQFRQREANIGVQPQERRRLGLSVGNMPVGNNAVAAKVHSIEAVNDTLWIGRDLGDVLVVSIAENHGYKCGQVVAILSMTGMLASPVNHLVRVGSDRVVVCQEIVGDSGLFKHHVLVWKSWGTEEFRQFDDVHVTLQHAIQYGDSK